MRYRCGRCNELPPVLYLKKDLSADESWEKFSWLSWADKVMQRISEMEVLAINTNITAGKMSVPIWEKYMLTVDEAVQYFGIGEKKIRSLIAENMNTEYCFTVQVGNKSLINRQKFETFLNQITSL